MSSQIHQEINLKRLKRHFKVGRDYGAKMVRFYVFRFVG